VLKVLLVFLYNRKLDKMEKKKKKKKHMKKYQEQSESGDSDKPRRGTSFAIISFHLNN